MPVPYDNGHCIVTCSLQPLLLLPLFAHDLIAEQAHMCYPPLTPSLCSLQVLILRELAIHTPTLFYQQINQFFDNIFVAVRDTRVCGGLAGEGVHVDTHEHLAEMYFSIV